MLKHDWMRLAIVVSAAATWSVGIALLAIQSGASHALRQHAVLFVGLNCICALSVGFCYIAGKRRPGYELGLTIIALNFALIPIAGTASFVLNFENVWIDKIYILIEILLPLGAAILTWQGVKKSRQQRREGSERMEPGE